VSDDVVKIEVDGKTVDARKGQMLIEVTDKAGMYIPRFCYHEKLSVAANCRMCLVEVEKAPKPMPACATPVMDGMKVFTRSAAAISAQKATMEFLLINHPLDCPICDQGGECELQDLALGYGRDVSRYNERKRVVKDKDIGPLVSTDMTRCIHCTRCVRFGEEITGVQELGTTERGEHMKIGTYVEKSIDHEMSANIIDLCPVGALNNKPYRYSARAWEMVQRRTVSAHDCAGSNMFAHVLRGKVKRVVPCPNEEINETWLSDRDRFSYEGIYSDDRLLTPRIKSDGEWQDASWEAALKLLSEKLSATKEGKAGFLASPSSTLEEFALLRKLSEHVAGDSGVINVDSRISQRDFSAESDEPAYPWLGCRIADLDTADALFIVGSDLRREVPIVAHRVRKAAIAGASVSFANAERYEYHFPIEAYLSSDSLVSDLAGIAVAAAGSQSVSSTVAALCSGVSATDEQKRVAGRLADAERAHVFSGLVAERHPAFAAVRALLVEISRLTGATVGGLSEGSNTAGACLAGARPHRGVGGEGRAKSGLNAAEMLDADLDALLLFGLEPVEDIRACDDVADKLRSQNFVAAMTPFASGDLLDVADVLLPIGTFAETAGTFVNCEARWQSFEGISNPVGEARPGWKVLRVLGNLLNVEGFDYDTSSEIREELVAALEQVEVSDSYTAKQEIGKALDDRHVESIQLYGSDAVVRRATALQLTPEAQANSAAEPADAAVVGGQ